MQLYSTLTASQASVKEDHTVQLLHSHFVENRDQKTRSIARINAFPLID